MGCQSNLVTCKTRGLRSCGVAVACRRCKAIWIRGILQIGLHFIERLSRIWHAVQNEGDGACCESSDAWFVFRIVYFTLRSACLRSMQHPFPEVWLAPFGYLDRHPRVLGDFLSSPVTISREIIHGGEPWKVRISVGWLVPMEVLNVLTNGLTTMECGIAYSWVM